VSPDISERSFEEAIEQALRGAGPQRAGTWAS